MSTEGYRIHHGWADVQATGARNLRAIREALTTALAAAAVACGHLIRVTDRAVRFAPGIGAACLVSWGAAQVYTPAGWILGGLFLLWADQRVTLRRGGGRQ